MSPRLRSRSASGSARAERASTAPPAQLLAVADVTGMAPGARVGYIGVPLDPPGMPEGASVDFGVAEERLRNGSVGLSDARTLEVFKQRIDDEGIPTITNMVAAMDGVRGERRRAGHHRTHRARRRFDPLRHRVGRALLEADTARPALPHRRQPARRLPAAAHRARAADLRVLHRRCRHRRRRRCGVHRARLHRPGRAADANVGTRADHAGDDRVRDRRPGGHPAVLDRRRHRVHGDRELVPVRVDPRRLDAARRGSR